MTDPLAGGLATIPPNSLYADVTYTWRVRAKKTGNTGLWSRWANFFYGHVSDPGNNPPGGNTPPDDGNPPASGTPAAPAGLSPDGGKVISDASVNLTCTAVSGATQYEFAIEVQNGTAFSSYYTYDGSAPSRTFWPQVHGKDYRFHVRAQNASGWGDFSSWAVFHFN